MNRKIVEIGSIVGSGQGFFRRYSGLKNILKEMENTNKTIWKNLLLKTLIFIWHCHKLQKPYYY